MPSCKQRSLSLSSSSFVHFPFNARDDDEFEETEDDAEPWRFISLSCIRIVFKNVDACGKLKKAKKSNEKMYL